ncbi:ABC transporter substrate-binding protein [Halosolutus gelatinilyticus]|uniref:ABC transporter substrate-binding protein n=1 Tax=Halosolutus gelatinilyticus TaxID=2931975 RepID=UPI001FF4AF82|nr:ABC transporter substrate-binding protein [Halosolutus gelatinilyticus]
MVNFSTERTRRSYIKSTGAVATAGLTAGCTLLDSDESNADITIATTIPMEGAFESMAEEMRQGYELGVAHIEETLGQEVEFLYESDESDPSVVRDRLLEMAGEADVIWGSFSSELVTAGSRIAEQEGIPFVAAYFAQEAPHRNENYEWTYAAFPKSRDVARSTVGLLELVPEDDRPTNVGIWEPNSDWGEEQSASWEETLDDAGYDVVLREQYEYGASDFTTLISRSANQDVEILLSVPTPPDGITMIQQMEDQGFSPEVIKFVRGADPTDWWNALEGNGEYVCMCPGWVPGLTDNGNEEMWSAYEDEYGLEDGEFIRTAVGGGYNVAQVTAQAIDAAGSTDPSDVQNALRSETFETVIGSFSFEDNGLPAEGELTAPTGQWLDGNQYTVYPDADDERAADFEYPVPAWSDR